MTIPTGSAMAMPHGSLCSTLYKQGFKPYTAEKELTSEEAHPGEPSSEWRTPRMPLLLVWLPLTVADERLEN